MLLAGVVVALGSLIIVHLLPTGLSSQRDPVSQYGITSYRGWYWSAAGGAALGGVGGALFFIPASSIISIVIVCVADRVRCGARMHQGLSDGCSQCRADPHRKDSQPSGNRSLRRGHRGGVHGIRRAPRCGIAAASIWSTGCGIMMAIGTVGILLAARIPKLGNFFGLAERLIYVGFLAWFSTLGILAVTS